MAAAASCDLIRSPVYKRLISERQSHLFLQLRLELSSLILRDVPALMSVATLSDVGPVRPVSIFLCIFQRIHLSIYLSKSLIIEAQLNSLQEDDKGASTKLDTQQDARRARDSEFDQENPQDGTTTTAASPSTSDADERTNVGCNREDNGIGQVVTNASCRRPSPASQRRIIKSLSSTTPVTVVRESNDTRPPSTDWTYTVSRVWYRRWEDYVGRAPRGGASPSSVRRVDCPSPGPVEMDSEDDDRNLFVSEDVWKRLVSWYGVSANHQLNRRNSVESDEKVFAG